jgi:hypothetical protein
MTVSQCANHVQWCTLNPNLERNKERSNKNREKAANNESQIKKKQTKLTRYGDKNYNNIQQAKQTKLIKYGNSFYNNPEKRIKTTLDRYGVPHVAQSSIIKDKTKATNLLKYGYEHRMQNPEEFEKWISHSSTNKKYILPSGKIINVQGYEPKALDLLFSTGYNENDLLLQNRPIIKYEYQGKTRIYHPDIIIISENKIIEVKSKYTYEKYKMLNEIKKQASMQAGWNFEFMIF